MTTFGFDRPDAFLTDDLIDRRRLARRAVGLGLATALGAATAPQPGLAQDATPAADVEERAATMRRWFTEGWAGNLALADEIFDPGFTNNGTTVGPEGPKRNVANRLIGFPDLQSSIEEQIAIDDKVVTRVLWSGTHTGDYIGVPPTNQAVEVRGIIIWRFAGGKVVEDWTVIDQFGLLQQIGVLPETVAVASPPVPESTEGAS